jgi:hypothetical protein
MQAAIAARTNRSNATSWLGVLPIALFVGLAACTSTVPSTTTTSTNPTDPSCRAMTCSSIGKNCGIVSDGCGGELRCGTCAGTGNNCINNVCERGCSSNSECPNGSSCINGSCTDKCNGPSDCPSGQTCTNGTCTASSAQYCTYDSQCRSDERCQNNYCVSTTQPGSSNRTCSYDSQCLTGESCRNGLCTNVGGQTCRMNQDCPYNETCQNGYCYVVNGGSQSCRSDYDCTNGARCNYGTCTNYGNGGNYNGNVRAQCLTTGISLPLPFGDVNISVENYYYDAQNPSGERVDSCTCGTGVMHLSNSYGNQDVGCSRCIKDGDTRTCYAY